MLLIMEEKKAAEWNEVDLLENDKLKAAYTYCNLMDLLFFLWGGWRLMPTLPTSVLWCGL